MRDGQISDKKWNKEEKEDDEEEEKKEEGKLPIFHITHE